MVERQLAVQDPDVPLHPSTEQVSQQLLTGGLDRLICGL